MYIFVSFCELTRDCSLARKYVRARDTDFFFSAGVLINMFLR